MILMGFLKNFVKLLKNYSEIHEKFLMYRRVFRCYINCGSHPFINAPFIKEKRKPQTT